MDWRQWKLEDWNRALVATLFFDQERLNQPVRRVEASDKFLAKATGDTAAGYAEARKAFIRSFGQSGATIRAYYEWSSEHANQTRRQGYPSIVAPLYLTLLAASADETTHSHGNFRERFATLLKPVEVGHLGFGDLPSLWKHVEAWSVRRAKNNLDCRVLQLPPVRWHDRLISHSKLLAFPAYIDELRLQEVLGRAGLDSDSTFQEIAHHVSARLGKFSKFFQEEFEVFRNHLNRAENQEAYQTPFWSAVEALTWENQRELARTTGEFALGIDVTDPAFPEFYLLADDIAASKLPRQLATASAPRPGRLRNFTKLADGKPWNPALVESAVAFQANLARLKLWKRLKSGCIALYFDEFGNRTSEGSHIDGAGACIIAKGAIADELTKTSKNLRLKFTETRANGGFAPWRVFLFEELLERQLQRLGEDMPDDARHGLQTAWRPPRISFSGGAWDGQMLLLNPASVPLVGMPKVASGSFQVLNEGGDVLAEGGLEPTDGEGRLAIPPKTLAALAIPHTLKVAAVTKDAYHAEYSLSVTTMFPPSAPTPLPDPTSWLADGPGGMLSYIDGHPGAPRQPGSSARSLPLPKFERCPGDRAMQLVEVGLDAIPPALDWLCEALALRFQTRATLPFSQLMDHINPASEASGVPAWQLKRLLLSSGLLQTVQKRDSPYTIVVAAPRTISLGQGPGQCVARISGLLSKSERAALAAILMPEEQAFRLSPEGPSLGIGVIELRLSGPGRILKIATSLGLVVAGAPLPAPLSPPREFPAAIAASGSELPRDAGLEAYNAAKQRWEPATTAQPISPKGMFFRLVSKQKRDYWISTGSGYMWTDSLTWAQVFRTGIAGKPFGHVLPNGDCVFDAGMYGLPPPLVQWWLQQGGGYVGIGREGQLVFAGGASDAIWKQAGGWFPHKVDAVDVEPMAALERRRLALSLRKRRSN
ncbi:MAG TPA: hypothetical protein VJ698_14130 [Noviherbaspirillum sp.]|uniref:hypothetical protein n=1 Tax=Noviherbaspirillum sp. TaxID=1926288 RepID=UPI002B4A9C36|nr:hypothetical protein [Noviherbaspirillum sp.]HJV86605.1 hypothetical protein [Noviherbaspirillum sp.]